MGGAHRHGHGGRLTTPAQHHPEGHEPVHYRAMSESGLHFGLGAAHAHAPGMSQSRMLQVEQDILAKNNRSISVIIYPSGGVYSDSDMRLPVGGIDQPVSAISLCYGLGNVAPTPPDPEPPLTLKSCDTVGSALDFTGVSCPTSTSERQLVCNFELDKDFYGLKDGSDSCCVCNSPALTECNPDLPAGTFVAEGVAGPCPDAKGTSLPVGQRHTEVTTHIELNNDPYYCTTVGSGPRICYKY